MSITHCSYCIVLFLHFLICSHDDGYFVRPKHVAASAFTLIKFACRRNASLLLLLLLLLPAAIYGLQLGV